MRKLAGLVVSLGLVSFGHVAPAFAGADEDADLKAQVEEALHDNRWDIADDLLGDAVINASKSNRPSHVGRLELYRAELYAEHPTARSVESAKAAILHLGDSADQKRATLRYHVSGAAVALEQNRLGVAALHVQEGWAALSPFLAAGVATGDDKKPAGAIKDTAREAASPKKDEIRLIELERGVVDKLAALVEEHHGEAEGIVDVGALSALSAYVNQKPLVAQPGFDEPVPVKTRPPGELHGKLEKALAIVEERGISTLVARNDVAAVAVARARHADTLVRVGRREDAIEVRKLALAYYREKGNIEQVVLHDHWLTEQLTDGGKDKKAILPARRDTVKDLEDKVATLAGPARAALRQRHRADYLAYLDALLATQRGDKPEKAQKKDAVDTGKDQKAIGGELLEAVDLLRDRSIWDDAELFGDAARWKKVGPIGGDLRRALDGVFKDDVRKAGDEAPAFADPKLPSTRARQRVADALAAAEPSPALAAIDLGALSARLGPRPLVIYARVDAERIAAAVLPAKGAVSVIYIPLRQSEETAWALALRDGLRKDGDAWKTPSAALYQSLVWPLEPALGKAPGIVVVPDGALAEVPFGALGPASADGSAQELLGERIAITFFPSLRALLRPKAPKVESVDGLLLGVSRSVEPGAYPLPGADREITAVTATLEDGGRKPKAAPSVLLAAQLAADPGSYDVMHFSARARFDGDAPVLGYLAFATSHLFGFDFGSVTFKTNLLVVDGAGSGDQPILAAARGLAGLVSGALVGPAAAVVISQWPTEGPASAALLCRFYERYAGGEPPAAALAGAQRDMAAARLEQPLLLLVGANPLHDGDKFSSPRYWAPFALWGGI